MNLDKISNPIVKAAITAWQNRYAETWKSLFTADAELFDDGSPRDFASFNKDIGREYFISIDKVENRSLNIYGEFHSDKGGNFKAYFKFKIKGEKITRLDVGQAR